MSVPYFAIKIVLRRGHLRGSCVHLRGVTAILLRLMVSATLISLAVMPIPSRHDSNPSRHKAPLSLMPHPRARENPCTLHIYISAFILEVSNLMYQLTRDRLL